MKTLGVLYISLGDYHVFWDDFYRSAESFFLPDFEKTYFIFTDNPHFFKKYQGNIKIIETKRQGWPYDTLLRFKFFIDAQCDLEKMDYLFFCNANLLFVDTVGLEAVPPEGSLTVVNHPGFWNKFPCYFTYERRRESSAYISILNGKYYVFGAFNGGAARQFLKMAKHLSLDIDADLSRNITAIWHDESHLNRWCVDHPIHVLDPSYCYPEGWSLPFKKRIIVREKDKVLTKIQMDKKNRETKDKYNTYRLKKSTVMLEKIVQRMPQWALSMIYNKKL